MPKNIIIILLVLTACSSNDKTYDTQRHPFDTIVINRIPVYDSLGQLIMKNFASLSSSIEEHYFYYTHTTDTSVLLENFPPGDARRIHHYMNQIGEDNIYRFDVFKDSSIKFYIRDNYLDEYRLNIRERLSYIPGAGNIQPRQPPVKDTIIGRNWQYWISFEEKGFEIF